MLDLTKFSKIEPVLDKAFALYNNNELKIKLFRYLLKYQEIYWFDSLEITFSLLEDHFLKSYKLTTEEKNLITEEVNYGRYEYFMSLNEISEAIYLLLNSDLNKDIFIKIVKHILTAYSCNSTDFWEPEKKYMKDLFKV